MVCAAAFIVLMRPLVGLSGGDVPPVGNSVSTTEEEQEASDGLGHEASVSFCAPLHPTGQLGWAQCKSRAFTFDLEDDILNAKKKNLRYCACLPFKHAIWNLRPSD